VEFAGAVRAEILLATGAGSRLFRSSNKAQNADTKNRRDFMLQTPQSVPARISSSSGRLHKMSFFAVSNDQRGDAHETRLPKFRHTTLASRIR
jgi:hypothetical protein